MSFGYAPALSHGIKTTEVVQMISAGLAATAAGASSYSARQSHKSYVTGLLPQLDGYWDNDYAIGVRLVIHNTGGGIAREPYLCVVADAQIFGKRIVKTGPLRNGEQQSIVLTGLTRPAPDSEIVGILCCLDWSRRWHVWAWDGRHRILRDKLRRSPKALDPNKALQLMYPRVSLDDLPDGVSSRVSAEA